MMCLTLLCGHSFCFHVLKRQKILLFCSVSVMLPVVIVWYVAKTRLKHGVRDHCHGITVNPLGAAMKVVMRLKQPDLPTAPQSLSLRD